MRFSELLERMLNGETLSAIEKQDMVLQARRLEDAEALLSSMVQPGTRNLTINNLTASNANIDNGTVVINTDGISIPAEGALLKNNAYKFVDGDGEPFVGLFAYYSSNLNYGLLSSTSGYNAKLYSYMTMSAVASFSAKTALEADSAGQSYNTIFQVYQDSSNRYARLQDADTFYMLTNQTVGTKFGLAGGASADPLIELRAEGSASGSTFLRSRTTSRVPDNPSSLDAFHIYLKGNCLVIQFNDSGTVRYKYLDLTGTGVTWQHSTTSP